MAVVYRYHTAWAGFQVAYPSQGAMREPSHRDRRERDILPRLFCFHNFEFEFGQFGDDWPALHCAPKLRERK